MKHVDITEEAVNEWIRRVFVDFLRCTDLLDIALMHDDDTIGDFQRFLLVMRDENAGNM